MLCMSSFCLVNVRHGSLKFFDRMVRSVCTSMMASINDTARAQHRFQFCKAVSVVNKFTYLLFSGVRINDEVSAKKTKLSCLRKQLK